MFRLCLLSLSFVSVISAFPLDFIRSIAEGYRFNDIDNYLPKYDDVLNDQFSANNFEVQDLPIRKDKYENVTDFKKNIEANYKLEEEVTTISMVMENETSSFNKSEVVENMAILGNLSSTNMSSGFLELNLESNSTQEVNETVRLPRQELNETKSDPEFESQEEGSSEEEGNLVTGLISSFLGGLSKPDGGIDVEAIVGLLGSLSTQNDDGTYDFQGLTDLLRGFLGGGDDEGGGSDVGSFLGGLLGAFIKGVANPPGSKGAGIFTGKVVTGILPALSAPPPADDADDMNMENKPQGLDSGGFLSGLIKTILSSSGGGNAQGGGGGSNLFKIIFQLITSVLSASSKSH